MAGRSFYPPGRTKTDGTPLVVNSSAKVAASAYDFRSGGKPGTPHLTAKKPTGKTLSPLSTPQRNRSPTAKPQQTPPNPARRMYEMTTGTGGSSTSPEPQARQDSSLLVSSALGRVDRDGWNRANTGLNRSPGGADAARRRAIQEETQRIVEAEKAKKYAKKATCRLLSICDVLYRYCQSFHALEPEAAWALLNPVSRTIAEALLLKAEDIMRISAAFRRIDIDNSGSVDFEEFFHAVQDERTPFTDFVFTLTTDPESQIVQIPVEEQVDFAKKTGKPSMRVRGRLTFNDFFQVCCIYCCYSRYEILEFAFNSFDRDGSRIIDDEEYRNLCTIVNNFDPMFAANFELALLNIGWTHSGGIRLPDFKRMNDQFPMLLFPAFRLQDALQGNTLGKSRWVALKEDVNTRRELDVFRQAHNGHLPALPLWRRILCCGDDPRWERYGFQRPSVVVEVKASRASSRASEHDDEAGSGDKGAGGGPAAATASLPGTRIASTEGKTHNAAKVVPL